MFLPKKYIFETRHTKFIRKVFNLFFLLIIFFLTYVSLCFYVVFFSSKQNEITEKFLLKNRPQVVVIFTGDAGRIGLGLQIAKESEGENVFISGVSGANSIPELIKMYSNPSNNFLDISDKVDVDYQSRNTIENVLSTLRYLQKKGEVKDVLIVSNDYHLSRISLILTMLKDKSKHYNFLLLGRESNYKSLRTIKILCKEVYKWLKTLVFLFLWESELYNAQ